jgi:YNFM family putative membrane transporter
VFFVDKKGPYLLIITYLTIVVFATIYGPQPLLLVLRSEFGISEATASLMITAILIPLSFAPLLYGYLLETAPIKKLLMITLSLLAVGELGIALASDFWIILSLRFFQGLIVPAILTALMMYVSTMHDERNMQRAFAVYVAATIFGGVFGRIFSGAVSTLSGWRFSFLALSIAMIIGLVLLQRLSPAPKAGFQRLSPGDVLDTLHRPGFLRICLLISSAFFVFVSLANVLPFRLADISHGISEFKISMAYSGYLVGIIVALSAPRLVALFRSEANTLLAGLCCYLAAIGIFLAPAAVVVFVNMFLFCGSIALLQAVCVGSINKLVSHHKGVANGLYISIYYAGASLGSYLPGWVYTYFGWNFYLFCLAFVLCIALYLAWGLRNKNLLQQGVV